MLVFLREACHNVCNNFVGDTGKLVFHLMRCVDAVELAWLLLICRRGAVRVGSRDGLLGLHVRKCCWELDVGLILSG